MSDGITLAAGGQSRWIVELRSGHTAEVWADAFGEEQNTYVFEVLVDIEGDLPPASLVLGRTPSDPRRMRIAVARFPKVAVRDVLTA